MTDSSPVQVYISSVSSSMELKHRQQKIKMVLESKHIPHVMIDIASDTDAKQTMRDGAGDPTALPPRIFRADKYIGDYQAFDDALESETLNEFLGL